MSEKLKYPVGIQSFEKLRSMNYAYADKTMYIKKMLESPAYYFLSRPRRFGKSLFLSTLESYFEGKREFFHGLDIDSDEMDWTPRPVIKISLNTIDPKSDNSLINYIDSALRQYEKTYAMPGHEEDLSRRFELLIQEACRRTGRKAVILIDEYDSPLLCTLDNEKLNKSYRDTLRALFSVLKNADEYIHFAFITGVSRFSHTSLFSGANNLLDISFDNRFAAICGITEEELRKVLMPGVTDFAKSLAITAEKALSLLKENYDGYHFSKRCPDIYNPFSLLNALSSNEIDNYWFRSGTASFLLTMLKRDNFYLPRLDCIESETSDLSAKESYLNNPVALLYEAGYVTIKRYDEEIESYILGLPNKEVSTSFSEALLPIYSDMDFMSCRDSFILMRRSLLKGEPDTFMHTLQTFLEGNPYSNTEIARRETYFKNNIYIIFKALGFMPRVEEETCRLRMDVMLRTKAYIFIFELKTNRDTGKALEQINNRGYALPYADEGRKIITIAANYSTARNNIDSWDITILPAKCP